MPLFSPDYVVTSQYTANSANLVAMTSYGHSDTTLSVGPFQIEDNIQFSQVAMPVSISLATSGANNTAAMNLSAAYAIYTRSGSTLTPIVGNSSTTTYTWASNTGVYSSLTGLRLLTFNLSTQLTPGQYFFGVQFSTASNSSIGTATTALRGTISVIYGSIGPGSNSLLFAEMSAATNASWNPIRLGQGIQSVSMSATNQTLQLSNITQSGTHYIRGNPILIFRGV